MKAVRKAVTHRPSAQKPFTMMRAIAVVLLVFLFQNGKLNALICIVTSDE